jgi:hypothetical protein
VEQLAQLAKLMKALLFILRSLLLQFHSLL